MIAKMEEDFVRLKEVLAPVGVYVLYWQGKVVYVGKSLNIFGRLSTHFVQMRRRLNGAAPYAQHQPPILFDDVGVKWCTVEEINRVEIGLIARYRPRYNTQHLPPHSVAMRIPALKELLARAKKQPVVNRRNITPAHVHAQIARYRRRVVVNAR
jgi:hypothetical protein